MCSLGRMTSNSINRGLAAMPAQERPSRVDGRGLGGDQSHNQRRHPEAMARNTSPQGSKPRADVQPSQWDDADWDQDHDEAAGHRARRLLSNSNSVLHRLGDNFGGVRRRLPGGRWGKRGAGPINLEMATPWLAAAIEENIGHGNTVEVGGTQIERAGRIRIAVRIRDIIVRDRDHAVVASAPKAEGKLSGTALLMGRLRAESLNLVDAELAVRITPDGYVTVSAGDNAKPLATGVTSKKQAGMAPTFPHQIPGAPPSAIAAPGSPQSASADNAQSGLLAGLDWLDSLSLTGLDGQNLNEIGFNKRSPVLHS